MLPRLSQRLVNRRLAGPWPGKVSRLSFRLPDLYVHKVLRSPHIRYSGECAYRPEPLTSNVCAWIGRSIDGNPRGQQDRSVADHRLSGQPALCVQILKAPVRPVPDSDHMPNGRADRSPGPRNHSRRQRTSCTSVSRIILCETNMSTPQPSAEPRRWTNTRTHDVHPRASPNRTRRCQSQTRAKRSTASDQTGFLWNNRWTSGPDRG